MLVRRGWPRSMYLLIHEIGELATTDTEKAAALKFLVSDFRWQSRFPHLLSS